MILTDELFTIR